MISYIQVLVVDDDEHTIFEDKYDDHIMTGELIRNLCVNINIDPDTFEGITSNVDVYRDNKIWNYKPTASLKELNLNDNKLVLLIRSKKTAL